MTHEDKAFEAHEVEICVNDEERREVARRLRDNPEDTLIPHRTGRHHGMGCHEAADRFWDMCDRIKAAGIYDIAFSTCSVLADLIEPRCDRGTSQKVAEEMRHSTKEEMDAYEAMLEKQSVELHPVDRDALLALADEIQFEREFGNTDYESVSKLCAQMDDCARRIREACDYEGLAGVS